MKTVPQLALVTDSAGSLPHNLCDRYGIIVVPLEVTLNGKTYIDGKDITATNFYQKLRETSILPSTSAPSPARFLNGYRKASTGNLPVLCLTVSSSFSASYNAALAAAEEARHDSPTIEVTVLDTRTAAGAEGLVALKAAHSINQGDDLAATALAARQVMAQVQLVAFIDTLYYLWKSGRVPRIVHAGTSLLGIKPVFELQGGEAKSLGRPRTRRRAKDLLLHLLDQRVGVGELHATVMHADAEDEAEELCERIESKYQCREIFVSEFTPAMGAHIGPGLLGIAFWTDSS